MQVVADYWAIHQSGITLSINCLSLFVKCSPPRPCHARWSDVGAAATGQLAGHEEEGNSSRSSVTTSRPETGESERGSTFKGLGTSPVDSLGKDQLSHSKLLPSTYLTILVSEQPGKSPDTSFTENRKTGGEIWTVAQLLIEPITTDRRNLW